MSAWIVSKAHIDVLVQTALDDRYFGGFYNSNATTGERYHPVNEQTADEVGAMLWAENHESVNFRYTENEATPTYTYQRRKPQSPVAVLKAIACYEYQTCEHDGWSTSDAIAFCEALRHTLCGRLPGYDEAPWGFDEDDAPPDTSISLLGMAQRRR